MRGLLITAALALLTVLALGIQTALVTRAGFLMGDFHAFYCAARVAAGGADPYRTEPLRSCEQRTGLQVFFRKNPGVAVPAPLPGYALAILMPLASLPARTAAAVWIGALLLACAGSVLAIVRFAGVPWPVPVGAFTLSLGAASLPFGEIVPIAIAAICTSAYFAWRGKWPAAAGAAAIAMIEPHLGLPVCIALAVWAPGARWALGIAAVALATISLLALGPAANVEYFVSVLPAHAISEAARDTQFSLTAVLAGFGTGDALAARAGTVWYAAMLAIGVIVGGRLARDTKQPAFLVCVPPAFAVFGGTFVHVTQIAVALPAALLLLSHARAERRALAIIAALLLAVPWVMAWSPALGLAPAFPIGYMVWRYWEGNLRAVAIAVGVAFALIVGLNYALTAAAGHPALPYAGSPIDPQLAEASWSIFTAKSSNSSVAAWLVRLPTWGGLALLLGLASTAAKLFHMRAAARQVAL